MDKLVVIFVVGAADAVIPLPAVLLVPVAADQMAETIVAEGGKGEHVSGAALNASRFTNSLDRSTGLFIFCSAQNSPLQPAIRRRSSQFLVRADEKRNCRTKVDREGEARAFVPGHRPSSPDRPWSRGGRTRRSWRGICGRKTRLPRTFCIAKGGVWIS